MVIGAMPMPADTSDTARLRCVSNQPVTQAIIGAKIAAVAAPTSRPKMSWNAISDVARLASARLAARTIDPVSDDEARTEAVRQVAPGHAGQRHGEKADGHRARYAGDRPAGVPRDGQRKTGSENIAPIATQPSRPPAATITQR